MPTRVFMVGKSNKVMRQMADEMGPDFAVTFNDDIALAVREFKPAEFDVVIVGRALKPEDQEVLLSAIRGTGSHVPIITSLAPQGKLSAAHARAAISGADPGPKVLTGVVAGGDGARFELAEPAQMTVTLYTLSAFTYQLKCRPIVDAQFPAGKQQVAVPLTIGDRLARKHLYVAADNGEAYLIKLRGL